MRTAIVRRRDGGAPGVCHPLPFDGFCATPEETIFAIDVVTEHRAALRRRVPNVHGEAGT